MDVVFVWSDRLAEVVTAAGFEIGPEVARQLETWRMHPTGHRLPDDGDALAYALVLLGIDGEEMPERCACGMLPAPMSLADAG